MGYMWGSWCLERHHHLAVPKSQLERAELQRKVALETHSGPLSPRSYLVTSTRSLNLLEAHWPRPSDGDHVTHFCTEGGMMEVQQVQCAMTKRLISSLCTGEGKSSLPAPCCKPRAPGIRWREISGSGDSQMKKQPLQPFLASSCCKGRLLAMH